MALHAYRRNALVVEHYTSGDGHPSAAHVVGGFKYRILRTLVVILSQIGVVSINTLGFVISETTVLWVFVLGVI